MTFYTVCMYVCMYVCTYVRTYVRTYSYQPEGWLDPHTVPAPDAHTHTHAHTCPCTAHPIPPLRGVLSQELNGVGWPVPFPLRTAHSLTQFNA